MDKKKNEMKKTRKKRKTLKRKDRNFCKYKCYNEQAKKKTNQKLAKSAKPKISTPPTVILMSVTYLRYTVLMSPKKDETAVHCCDPALSVHVMFGVSKRL